MIYLESLKEYILGLSYKEVLRIFSVYIIAFFVIVLFLVYRHFGIVVSMEQKTKQLNKARQQVQVILTEFAHIKNKKSEVDDLLAKDKSFYIQKYYQDTIATLHIPNQTVSTLKSQSWPNGYIEESVEITLSLITMKDLCQLLQALQKTPQVFIKNIDISKANVEQKINVNMAIATLKLAEEKSK